MKYISTRGGADPVDFTTACLSGLAPDGGLYVPESWPQIARPSPQSSYVEVATQILSAFAGDAMSRETIGDLCAKAYASFAHECVAPLVQYGANRFIMELHHGPTLAFKDVAMQFIGQFYNHALAERDAHMTIVCATSGDTGGAAAAAFAGLDRVNLVILHPHERISPVQRRFMTTTGASNIVNLAINSDFDECQSMVKGLFADADFAREVGLSGVNSINWARIAAQSVYFAMAQASLGADRPLRFFVPSGNMGDALAGYVAARCGLLNGLDIVCAVNENRALETVFETGRMTRTGTVATPSPAMDITVPSNLERVLFEASGRDSDMLRGVYQSFAQSGDVQLPEQISGPLGCMGFAAHSVSNDDTMAEIAQIKRDTDWLVCPHTAVASLQQRRSAATEAVDIVLSTAHAAKFPETVQAATGDTPDIPARCTAAASGEEVFERMDVDLSALRARLREMRA